MYCTTNLPFMLYFLASLCMFYLRSRQQNWFTDRCGFCLLGAACMRDWGRGLLLPIKFIDCERVCPINFYCLDHESVNIGMNWHVLNTAPTYCTQNKKTVIHVDSKIKFVRVSPAKLTDINCFSNFQLRQKGSQTPHKGHDGRRDAFAPSWAAFPISFWHRG